MTEKLKLVEDEKKIENPYESETNGNDNLRFFKKMQQMRIYISSRELQVDGYNEHQRYEYSSAKQYKAILNEACLECGMEMYTTITNAETIALPNEESKQHLTRIHITLVLTDLDTGYSIGFPLIADGCDSLDKGIYKAETMAIKSFVQTTFLRHDKDEIDPESSSRKAPKVFTSNTDREAGAKSIVSTSKRASEEMIDRIFNAVTTVRQVEPTYLQDGNELEKFNNGTITEVEATSLLLNIEEHAEEIGVVL